MLPKVLQGVLQEALPLVLLFAVWLWDEESSTEAVAFYDLDIDNRGALEVRMWSPQGPTTTAERKEIAESFNMYPKRAFSDANRRAVRISELVN